jgi:hypothetical protein
MKNNPRILLFVALILVVMSTACGTPATSTPTAAATVVPTEVEMTPTDEMPVATSTGETPTPTATGVATTIPVQLVCFFCVQQVPHALVTLPESATIEVPASSTGIECNRVETAGDQQIVLCQGPAASGMVSFDVNVCSNGNCTERQLTAVDCSAEPATPTPTPTPTSTTTMTPTAILGGDTATPTAAGAAATATPTPASATATPTP